jgi:hypothetical protein
MAKGRIFFAGSPWPEGHPVKKFLWTAEQRGSTVWFGFHLETEDYYSEREIEDDDSVEYLSDWAAPIVWGNFHSCTISSNHWHDGGFAACSLADFNLDHVDGLRLQVDPLPLDLCTHYEERAFHIYLLGHDAVADHQIAFSRVSGTDLFDIDWQGRIALTYTGDDAPRHRFRAEIKGIELPTIGADRSGR